MMRLLTTICSTVDTAAPLRSSPMIYDPRAAELIRQLSAERWVLILENAGLSVSDRERESIEWLRFKVDSVHVPSGSGFWTTRPARVLMISTWAATRLAPPPAC
jgi:hypothetical protein